MSLLFKKRLFWLFTIPVYLWIAIVRHEGSHALVAKWEGATIQQFTYIPSYSGKYGFLWGHVSILGETTWFTLAAPYFFDIVSFSFFFSICMLAKRIPYWIWINMVIIGMILPIVNTLYNYQSGFWRPYSDVALLFQQIPEGMVHGAFLITLTFYSIGLLAAFKYSRFAVIYCDKTRSSHPPSRDTH